MGRRSRFTPAQKRDAVLAVLMKKKTVSEVCRNLQVSETSFNRWREQALEAIEGGDGRQGRPWEGRRGHRGLTP